MGCSVCCMDAPPPFLLLEFINLIIPPDRGKTDPGSGWGSNEGRIRAFPTTISNCQTKDGKIIVYASEAEFTNDPIEESYFGCAGVCEIPNLEDKMIRLARGGFKHHTSVGVGHMKDILKEAFTTYLHYDWVDIDKD